MARLLTYKSLSGNPLLVAAFAALTLGLLRPAAAADLEAARELFKTGQYARCLEAAQKAIEERAFFVEWRTLLIESRMALGQYEKAAEDMDTALPYYSLSLRLMELAHRVYQHSGQGEKAAEMPVRAYRLATGRRVGYLDARDLVVVGQCLLLLDGEPRLILDEFYNRAIEADPNCREAHLAAGSLAIAKQDYELAANHYRKALERFGDDPDAHYGLAEAFYNSDRKSMIQSLDAALHVNPFHARSLLLLAEHHIDCEAHDSAGGLLDRVVAVNPWRPEAWAYRALLSHLANDPNAADGHRAKALKFWPTNPQVDYLIGRKLSQKYRFAEGAEYQRRALKFDPNHLPAKIQLAEDLLRLGDERGGWALADEVHSADAYNVQAYNLVNLRDNLSKFRTLETDGFIVKMEEREAAVYGDRVAGLLREARSALCKKYGLKLGGPVTVELFDNQQDFAVRTFGMPGGDGFLAVCFGNVITANSPKAQRPSNWQAMLWHEFCHVVTLNLTRNKMPRWLSEGISVYEEWQRDPTWRRRMDPEYRKMVLSGELTPVGSLSGAFLNPPTPAHLQFAYYESSLVVEFLIEKFGFDSLKAILGELAEGEQINTAISRHAAPIGEIEKSFEEFARKRAADLAPGVDWEQPDRDQLDPGDPKAVAKWLAGHPNNFWALRLHAGSLLADQKWEQATKPLEKLISLYPEYTGEGNAYRLLAEACRRLGRDEQEREALEKLAAISSEAAYTYARLMEIETERENWRAVLENGERYLAVYPLQGSSYLRLGRANEELGRDEQAVESYRRLLLLDPADPVDVNYRLARLLRHREPGAARKHILDALADAPRFRQGHRLLLEIVEAASGPPAGSNDKEPSSMTQENSQ
ncbi:MAG: tetratricopeptide repeat protein [Phycisphaerales bacterium]|nr:MAG: tetratricopeptide repeat protein [Phycisphaerales bacterium]